MALLAGGKDAHHLSYQGASQRLLSANSSDSIAKYLDFTIMR
jgi:hypothetical protein